MDGLGGVPYGIEGGTWLSDEAWVKVVFAYLPSLESKDT